MGLLGKKETQVWLKETLYTAVIFVKSRGCSFQHSFAMLQCNTPILIGGLLEKPANSILMC